jgi:type II secretory pathway component GspD/PulD (secretin)
MKALVATLLLAPALAFGKAEPVSLNFNAVPLIQFGQAMFKGMMKRDFVVAPDVIALDKRITIDVKAISSDDLPRFVEDLLSREGVQTTLRDGVFYLTARRTDAQNGTQDVGSAISAPAQQSGPVSGATGPHIASAGIDGRISTEGLQIRKDDDESELFQPQHRTAEFVASVVAASFGPRAVSTAGGSVIVTGSKAGVAKIVALCKSLDTHPKMVDVSVSWIEVTSTSGESRGISLAATFLGAKLGASLGSVNSGSAVSLKNTKFEFVIDALNSDARFKQVTNSRLVGYDRTKLKLIVGDKTATVSSTGNDNAGNRVQNIVYTPSGVIIDALPRILGSGEISLDVDAQISSFKANTNGLIGSPTLILRQLATTVGIKDGDVILLGGLQDTQSSASRSGLAFLPASWSAESNSKQQTDLVLVVSAKVFAD